MSDFVSPSAGQTGVPRLEEKAPTFDFFQWVASSVTVEDGSEREAFEDDDGAMATHGGMDPGVIVAGTLLLHAQKRMPMKGDVLLAKDEDGFWDEKFLEVVESSVQGLVNGRPAACEVTMMWNAAKQAEYEAAGVADLDGPLPIVIADFVTTGGGNFEPDPVALDAGEYLVNIELTNVDWATGVGGQDNKVFDPEDAGVVSFSTLDKGSLGSLSLALGAAHLKFEVNPGTSSQSGLAMLDVAQATVLGVSMPFVAVSDNARVRVTATPF